MPKSTPYQRSLSVCEKCKGAGVVYLERIQAVPIKQPRHAGGLTEIKDVTRYVPQWCTCPLGVAQMEKALADYAARHPWED